MPDVGAIPVVAGLRDGGPGLALEGALEVRHEGGVRAREQPRLRALVRRRGLLLVFARAGAAGRGRRRGARPRPPLGGLGRGPQARGGPQEGLRGRGPEGDRAGEADRRQRQPPGAEGEPGAEQGQQRREGDEGRGGGLKYRDREGVGGMASPFEAQKRDVCVRRERAGEPLTTP